MPLQPQWLLQLPEIIAELAAMDSPVIDRAALERLFGVRRRRAIEMIGGFGGYQVGRTFVVDRQNLIAALEQMRQGGQFRFERHRKEKLTRELERVRRFRAAARVSIPVEKEDLQSKAAGLPPGVCLEAGRLTVTFATVEDLLRKLYSLGQAAANDFEAFKTAAEAHTA